MNKIMKKIYQNPQSEVVKTVACQRLMGEMGVSETPISGGGGNAPMRIPKSI